MKQVYKGRKYVIYSQVPIPKPHKADFKGYLYVVRFWDKPNERWFYKVGYSNHVIRRLTQECKAYKLNEVEIFWISPLYRESTARRIEYEQLEVMKSRGYEFIPRERFVLPKGEKLSLDIKVRKVYEIREL